MGQRTVIELGGWVGVAGILAAYVGASFGLLDPTDTTYPLLNGCGAILVTIDAVGQRNWQPALLNVVWAAVALVSLVRSLVL